MLVHPGKVSRTSLIYHFGLEGLGELRLESEAESDVCVLSTIPLSPETIPLTPIW
jgi:hypothetical protein